MFSTDPSAIAAQLAEYNRHYRAGRPIISDQEYDSIVEYLRSLDPEHPYLHQVEPEAIRSGASVRHKSPMLSTDKVYTKEKLERFVERVEIAAAELGIQDPQFRVTPKLDGMAGFDRDSILASRGDGKVGSDITHIFNRGVIPIGGRNQGAGEIVMVKSFFETHFADEFDHPRNVVVGIVNADELGEAQKKALRARKVHFATYKHLKAWSGSGQHLIRDIDKITANLSSSVDYPLDGMVAEAINERIKAHMGATNHHHKWQVAIKTKGETASTTVLDIIWQTGRTGHVTPVLKVEPTKVSGATISNISAHHAGMVRDKLLGFGAEITIIRSGEVIPKLETVLKPAQDVTLPDQCPSCNGPLSWKNDFLQCTNHMSCPAQVESGLRHWFKTLGNANGFGPSTIQVLVEKNYTTLEAIYNMNADDFECIGFGEKQSQNLEEALKNSRTEPIEDARFLAAFGILHLGIGESRRLLRHHPLHRLVTLSGDDIAEIHGFGTKTAPSIAAEIQSSWSTIKHMLDLGFQLEETQLESDFQQIQSPIAGKHVMFTGRMESGDRTEMQELARTLGATVLTSVSKKLEILIAGPGAGGSKLTKAAKYNINVIDEDAYLALIGSKNL